MASSSTPHSNIILFPRMPLDANGDTRISSYPALSRHGRTLKESRSTESLSQRKDRVDFLRQREWTRRAAVGGDYQPNIPRRRARTNSWEEIIAAADAAASTFDYNTSGYAGRTDTSDDGEDPDEPYVIYTASPRPPQSAPPLPYTFVPHTPGAVLIYSTSPSPSSTPSPPPTVSPLPSPPVREMSTIGSSGPYYSRRASWRGPHSRHSSLSSISEEDEGLARL